MVRKPSFADLEGFLVLSLGLLAEGAEPGLELRATGTWGALGVLYIL